MSPHENALAAASGTGLVGEIEQPVHSISNKSRQHRKRCALVIQFRNGDGPLQKANGREAETLIALINSGGHGITALEAFRGGWAVRLAAYVNDLRRMGVDIRTIREAHEGGSHGRYVLMSPVAIVSKETRA
jgi:Helix-turn-helix domain